MQIAHHHQLCNWIPFVQLVGTNAHSFNEVFHIFMEVADFFLVGFLHIHQCLSERQQSRFLTGANVGKIRLDVGVVLHEIFIAEHLCKRCQITGGLVAEEVPVALTAHLLGHIVVDPLAEHSRISAVANALHQSLHSLKGGKILVELEVVVILAVEFIHEIAQHRLEKRVDSADIECCVVEQNILKRSLCRHLQVFGRGGGVCFLKILLIRPTSAVRQFI